MNKEITITLPTSVAKDIFFDAWLLGYEPSQWIKRRIMQKLGLPVIEETAESLAALPPLTQANKETPATY